MKKIMPIIITTSIVASAFILSACSQNGKIADIPTFQNDEGLRVHAVLNSDDTEAWHLWQSVHDENFNVENESQKYFFLPTSADENSADIYNAYSETVTVNGVSIDPNTTQTVEYKINTPYEVTVHGETVTLTFMKSHTEAAIFINNTNADGEGTDLLKYLNDDSKNRDKSRTATAAGAILDANGNIDNTSIKNIKGRGNTSWGKTKKSYNVTYENPVSIAGMKEGKKYSLIANYQDDSLSRNRFLYDLADTVDTPYASDSRYVDLYVDGFYYGAYQMCEKIEVGKNSLVNDIKAEDYLNDDGSVKEDFPFLCVVDPGFDKNKDYYVNTDGGIITIKYPELQSTDVGYESVKNYVAQKYNEFYASTQTENLSEYGDIDSLSKVFLINEIGKNWDSGSSSVYFVYKPDDSGKYKFFGSPVWDYDNALGNATGVSAELKYFNITDYEEYTGWWCRYKGGSDNIMNRISQNPEIQQASKEIWFEKFVPAIDHFTKNEASDGNFKTSQQYYDLIKDSAEMNYTSGWLLKTSGWISDHSSLTKATFDTSSNTIIVDSSATSYQNDFTGMYNYCCDWFVSRSAWLSQQFCTP